MFLDTLCNSLVRNAPFQLSTIFTTRRSNAYNDKTRKEKMREGKRKKEKERKKKDETPLQLIHMSFVCDLCSEVI